MLPVGRTDNVSTCADAVISPVRTETGFYCQYIIWDPYTKADSNKLEKIQPTAARWILSSYSYKTGATSLLQQLQLESLEERRKVQRLAFMYKILNGQVALPAARTGPPAGRAGHRYLY